MYRGGARGRGRDRVSIGNSTVVVETRVHDCFSNSSSSKIKKQQLCVFAVRAILIMRLDECKILRNDPPSQT